MNKKIILEFTKEKLSKKRETRLFKYMVVFVCALLITCSLGTQSAYAQAIGNDVSSANTEEMFQTQNNDDKSISTDNLIKFRLRGISLNPKDMELEVGTQGNLIAEFTPYLASNKDIKWASSDPDVVSVLNESNNVGVVTAKKAGQARITITSLENNKLTAICNVKVIPKPTPWPIINFSKSKTTNNEKCLYATINSLNADEVGFVISRFEIRLLSECVLDDIINHNSIFDCTVVSTKDVYKSVKVNDNSFSTKASGENYVFACNIEDIPEMKIIGFEIPVNVYVRTFARRGSEIKYSQIYEVNLNK